MNKMLICLLVFFCVGQSMPGPCAAQEPSNETASESADEKAIRANGQKYLDAFHKGDAKAVAALWHQDGEFATSNGEVYSGRQAIEDSFAEYFEQFPNVKLEVQSSGLSFISPAVATSHGFATAVYEDGEVTQTEYEVVQVKRNGEWQIDRVAEANLPEVRSHYEQLKELEWMVGDWVDDDGEISITANVKWTTNSNFITKSFTVANANGISVQGTQIIGWDPAKKVIRSWTFDSDGGFGVGVWSQGENEWTVSTRHVLDDGSSATAINTYKRIDDNTYSFRSSGRTVDGKLMPNIAETKVYRQ